MRVAVLSDIHANLPALEAVITDLEATGPVDAIWQLGDTIGYGPDPNDVVARLADLGAIGVAGNHEAAALGRIDVSWFNEDARLAIEWTRAQLSEAARAWLAGLPLTRCESGFTLVHGSPRDPVWEYVASSQAAAGALAASETTHCLLGHTHDPRVFREDDGRIESLGPSDGSELRLDARRSLLNPGSVGQPRDGDPRASYLILDVEGMTATWHRVAYPVAETQARMREAGLPVRLIRRLELGF